MNKKVIIAVAVATLALAQGAKAQTNLQMFYDFAPDRQHITTTLEGFYVDGWGNTFFFIDYDFNMKAQDGHVYSPSGTYMEVARCFNFWQDSQLAPVSIQLEYNGGVYNGFTVNNAYLFGLDYFLHSQDYRNTLNIKLLGKLIDYAGGQDLNGNARKSILPAQLTLVWGMQDLFDLKGLRFSGFADVWSESQTVYRRFDTPEQEEAWYHRMEEEMRNKDGQADMNPEESEKWAEKWAMVKDSQVVFISEPQIWYNVGQHFGVNNLNVGGEVELSINFGGTMGFRARPCLGVKWVF